MHICFDYLVLISSERVLRESGRCRRIVRRPGPGSPGVVTFCALNHNRFLKASLFGSFMAFLMRNHTTFVIKFRFAMGRDFGYIKGLAGTMSSRLTSDIVHVLLDLLLLRPLFHLAVTFFVLAAFIFINLAIKKSNGENIRNNFATKTYHPGSRFVDVLARAFILRKTVDHRYLARCGEAFSLQFLVTR